jgi:hypothetical protein
MTTRYRRHPKVITRRFGGELFVITPSSIENLSAVSALVWGWLSQTCAEQEICQRIHCLYPDINLQAINKDIRQLMQSFEKKALVVPVNALAARKADRRRSTRR